MKQGVLDFADQSYLVWFSCGAASAVAAKMAVDKYGDRAQVLYCDTLINEHPDNLRFFYDVSKWIGWPIKVLKNGKYKDIYDVFNKTGYLVGPTGARCSKELKRNVRKKYESPGDVHIFGYTVEEKKRIERFELDNPFLFCEWTLADNNITKAACFGMLRDADIELPAMYKWDIKITIA